MIDPLSEDLLRFAEAARLFPRRRAGKHVSPSTVWRWCRHGHKGIRLEYVRVGGTLMTNRSAIREFLAALTTMDQAAAAGQAPPPPVPTRQRRAAIQRAEQKLAAAGI